MIIKAINITLGILVAFSVLCAAVVFMVVALHVAVAGGSTVYNMIQP